MNYKVKTDNFINYAGNGLLQRLRLPAEKIQSLPQTQDKLSMRQLKSKLYNMVPKNLQKTDACSRKNLNQRYTLNSISINQPIVNRVSCPLPYGEVVGLESNENKRSIAKVEKRSRNQNFINRKHINAQKQEQNDFHDENPFTVNQNVCERFFTSIDQTSNQGRLSPPSHDVVTDTLLSHNMHQGKHRNQYQLNRHKKVMSSSNPFRSNSTYDGSKKSNRSKKPAAKQIGSKQLQNDAGDLPLDTSFGSLSSPGILFEDANPDQMGHGPESPLTLKSKHVHFESKCSSSIQISTIGSNMESSMPQTPLNDSVNLIRRRTNGLVTGFQAHKPLQLRQNIGRQSKRSDSWINPQLPKEFNSTRRQRSISIYKEAKKPVLY